MPVPTIQQDASLAQGLDDAVFTQSRLAAHPLTAHMAADFDPMLTAWTAVNNQEIQIRIGLVKTGAAIVGADDTLNDITDAVAQAALLEAKSDKKKGPIYQLYFGKKAPNELKRPVLGGQLETMRGWVPSLLASSNPVLKDIGARLAAGVEVADNAVKAQLAAEQVNREFRTTGERKAFIDSLNALRKSTYGKLSEMPHAHPDKHLPADFAEGFFRHDSRKSGKPTAAELAAEIAALESDVADKKAQLVKVAADEEAAAKAKSEAEAHLAAIAEAEKEAVAAAAKVAALKAKKK